MARRGEATQIRSSAAPRYRTIEAILRDQIFTGEFGAGDKLPTEEELVRVFGVSRPTVRKALEILEQESLILREAGRGTFVNEIAGDLPDRRLDIALSDLVDLDFRAKIVIQRQGTVAARGAVQNSLDLPYGAEVFYFVRIYYRDSVPFGGRKIFLPRAAGKQLKKSDMTAPHFIDALSRRLRMTIASVDFRMEANLADARTSELFETYPGAPLISLRRTSRDSRGRPVEHSHLLFRSDLCQISFTQRRAGSSAWSIT